MGRPILLLQVAELVDGEVVLLNVGPVELAAEPRRRDADVHQLE
jgi:hypothetical protein